MRLSDVLSKPITTDYVQIEGFLGSRKLKTGNSKKIAVGKVALNYYCNNCGDQRTFYSGKDLFCIGVNEKTVSIDCVLECPRCGASVQMWFLLECREEDNIHSQYPYVRIAKRSEKFSESVSLNTETYGDFTIFLEKSKRAAREGFGAGSIVYLRTVFESVISQIGVAENISHTFIDKNGVERHKTTERYLKEVDEKRHIIPPEFSADGYKLFRELSGIVHGNYSEDEALIKFDAFYRLVTGVLDNIRNKQELMDAMGTLGWNTGGEENE